MGLTEHVCFSDKNRNVQRRQMRAKFLFKGLQSTYSYSCILGTIFYHALSALRVRRQEKHIHTNVSNTKSQRLMLSSQSFLSVSQDSRPSITPFVCSSFNDKGISQIKVSSLYLNMSLKPLHRTASTARLEPVCTNMVVHRQVRFRSCLL